MPHLQLDVLSPLSPLLPELASPASRNKPLPSLPTKLPAHAAAYLLSLLDACDAELVLHVSRVQAVIKETRGSVAAYIAERAMKNN